MSTPKWLSKELNNGWSITKVTECVQETKKTWLLKTEGWRGTVLVRKDGKGTAKPWSKEPRYL